MAKRPIRRNALEVALGKRGREILRKKSSELSGEVQLTELSIMSSQGDLMIERTSDYRMVYMESPNGHVLRTSLEDELAWALDAINRALVLEDLADV